MALCTLPLDTTVDLIAKGIETEFQTLLKAKLMRVAAEECEALARTAAKNVVERTEAIRRIDTGSIELYVQFGKRPAA